MLPERSIVGHMSIKKTVYHLTESIHCPLYVKGDAISLTMRSCSCADDLFWSATRKWLLFSMQEK
jgi:hypothetical protein